MTREQFAEAWHRQVREDLTTDPLIRSDVSAILARLNDLDAPRTTLDDIVTQRPGHTDYDVYDAAALRYIGLMLNLGRYVIATIQLDHPRQLSADLDEAQVNLGHLPYPFITARDGARGHRLCWTSPITISHAALPDRQLMIEYEPSDTAFASGPIEPATTLWHLRRSQGIARWPLGYDTLTLILATDSDMRRDIAAEPSVHAQR
jgi:hypothetical protein